MSFDACRLCLDCNSQTCNIFNDELEEKMLPKMIQKLFSIKVKLSDEFPKVVCVECIRLVKEFYTFSIRVKYAQKRLSQNKNTPAYANSSVSINLRKRINGSVKSYILSKELSANVENKRIKEEQSETDSTDINGISYPSLKSESISKLPLQLESFYKNSQNISNPEELLDSLTSSVINETIVPLGDDHSVNIQNEKDLSKSESSSKYDSQDLKIVQSHHLNEQLNSLNYPPEIYRNGKLTLKGTSLENLVKQFYNLTCNFCSTKPTFDLLADLFKHFEILHDTRGYVTCCNARLYQRRTIYLHMARHIQPSAFECPICKKSISRPNTLKLHLQTHLMYSEKPYKCDQCDKRYSGLSGLTSHKLSHIPLEKRSQFHCEICGKIFTLAKYHKAHMASVHPKEKFLCSECGRSFQTKINLNTHMMTHDPIGKYKAQCQHCGFVCRNTQSLQRHMRRHTSETLHCDMCDFNTHLKQQLHLHIRVKHSEEKPFVCIVCRKCFKLKNILNTHMAQHTGEKKFHCSFCPKIFASSGNYYTHRKRMHSDKFTKNSVVKKQDIHKINHKTGPEMDKINKSKILHNLARQELNQLKTNKLK